MSDEIEVHRIRRYARGIDMLAQQEYSRLRMAVRTETGVVGKMAFYDQVGATDMVEKTTRHTDTPLIQIPHRRRAVTLKFFHTADLIGEADVQEILNEPSGVYGRTMAAAGGRTMDKRILAEIFASSKTGEEGDVLVPLPAGQKVLHGGAALTLDKVLDAKEIKDANEVGEEIPRHAVVKAKQIRNMLGITEVTNADYNTVKALAQGQINDYLGYNWIRTELVNDDGASHALCPFFAETSVLLAIGIDIRGRVDVRPDKDYDNQIYYSMRCGSTRMDETGVVQVQCLI